MPGITTHYTRDEPEQPEAFDVGLRLLARREHSRAELSAKLAQRGFEQAEIGKALDRLQATDALNEARFAEQYVRLRLRQGYGPARIRADLAARGVDAATVETELSGAEDDDARWLARAEAARRRRFGGAVPGDYEERARQARFLERRGYPAAHIARVLRGEASDLEDNGQEY